VSGGDAQVPNKCLASKNRWAGEGKEKGGKKHKETK